MEDEVLQTNETINPVETEVETVTPEVEVLSEETQVEPEKPEVEVEETKVEPTDLTIEGVKFGEHNINFSIPAEEAQLLDSKGFNAKELTSELFSSKDFSFSKDTYDKLTEAFGKVFVDTQIELTKFRSDKIVNDYTTSKSKAEAEAFEAVSSLVGGEEGWSQLEAFASNQQEGVVSDFNEAMGSGNPVFQRLAVQNMKLLMDSQQTDKPLSLIQGKGAVDMAPVAITNQEYTESMINGEYYKDPSKWDNLRQAGINKGI